MRKWLFALLVVSLAVGVSACTAGTSVFELKVGDCIDYPELPDSPGEEVATVDRVDCSEPHDGQVIAVFDTAIEGDEYPGEQTLAQEAEDRCPPTTEFYLYPTGESWKKLDDREIVCIGQ